jgi:uncharacterized membrane protein
MAAGALVGACRWRPRRQGSRRKDRPHGRRQPEQHQIGTGIGGSAGALGGAAIGVAVAGPIGMAAGAAIGAAAGALAGEGAAK